MIYSSSFFTPFNFFPLAWEPFEPFVNSRAPTHYQHITTTRLPTLPPPLPVTPPFFSKSHPKKTSRICFNPCICNVSLLSLRQTIPPLPPTLPSASFCPSLNINSSNSIRFHPSFAAGGLGKNPTAIR